MPDVSADAFRGPLLVALLVWIVAVGAQLVRAWRRGWRPPRPRSGPGWIQCACAVIAVVGGVEVFGWLVALSTWLSIGRITPAPDVDDLIGGVAVALGGLGSFLLASTLPFQRDSERDL